MPFNDPHTLKIAFSALSDVEGLRSAILNAIPDLLKDLDQQVGAFTLVCNRIDKELALDFEMIHVGGSAEVITKHLLMAAFSYEDTKSEPEKLKIQIDWH